MNEDVEATLANLNPPSLEVVEISGRLRGDAPWKSYMRLEYPEFDLCVPGDLPGRFDLVICEQVIEHVIDPGAAIRTLCALCKEDGHVLISTPFLVRIHGHPDDFWRFTPNGLAALLDANGLRPLWVRSWGNARAVRGNFRTWLPVMPWHSLASDRSIPLVVWALARREREPAHLGMGLE